jgi:hypothetical protein
MDEELRWAYAAGLLDGEGCVSIHRNQYSGKRRPDSPRYHVAVQVGMSDPESIQEVADLWGRPMSKRTNNVKGMGRTYTSTLYLVNASAVADVARLLGRMLPYLRAKRTQAVAALAACEAIQAHFQQHNIPADVLDHLSRLHDECKALKVRNASLVTHHEAA